MKSNASSALTAYFNYEIPHQICQDLPRLLINNNASIEAISWELNMFI